MTNDQTKTESGDFSVAIAFCFVIGALSGSTVVQVRQQHWGFYPNDRFA